MPDFSLTVSTTDDRLPTIAQASAENGVLTSLSAGIHDSTTAHGRTHIIAGITNSTLPDGTFHTVLLDDYIYESHNPTWTGIFPLEGGDQILAIARSSDLVKIRITGRTITATIPLVHLEP